MNYSLSRFFIIIDRNQIITDTRMLLISIIHHAIRSYFVFCRPTGSFLNFILIDGPVGETSHHVHLSKKYITEMTWSKRLNRHNRQQSVPETSYLFLSCTDGHSIYTEGIRRQPRKIAWKLRPSRKKNPHRPTH